MEDVNNKTVHSSFWTNIFNYPTEKSDLQISLQSIPLFESLGKRDLSLILNIIHSRSYLTGEYISFRAIPELVSMLLEKAR